MTTIAVIQPYFYPYAGYFRLFAAADTVVLFDCVQFPRRGWVHRNRFALANRELDWLTLPLSKAPQDVRIADLQFRSGADSLVLEEMRRFPVLERARQIGHPLLRRALTFDGTDVATYLCATLIETAKLLGLDRPIIRSSDLGIASALRGQDRVLEIVRRLGGTRYVNPSGGRELYDHATFNDAGVELRFLTQFEGAAESTLSRLLAEPALRVGDEIRAQTMLVG